MEAEHLPEDKPVPPLAWHQEIHETAHVNPKASVKDSTLGANVMVSPYAEITGSTVGDDSNVQDRAQVTDAVVGNNSSIAHGARVLEGASVGDDTMVFLNATVEGAVGDDCFIGAGAVVGQGVKIPDGRIVPHFQEIRSQAEADTLPENDDATRMTNTAVVHVNKALAAGYKVMDDKPHIIPSPGVDWNQQGGISPIIDITATIDPTATIIGDVVIGPRARIGPGVVIRGDEGRPIIIGESSIIEQDCTFHALETHEHGQEIDNNLVTAPDGTRRAIYVGPGCHLGKNVMVHGPANLVGNNNVGDGVLLFRATIAKGVTVGANAGVMKDVSSDVAEGEKIV